MSKPSGEYIYLSYEWVRPEYEYIEGHVTAEEAIKALDFEGVKHGAIESVDHIYARYIPGQPDDSFASYFRECGKPGRGAFKVTRIKAR